MIYIKTDSSKYIAEFKERFTNFAQKAPILLSFVTSDDAVQVIHENSGTAYKFEWDFTIPVKSFIHEIKQTLSDSHYPRLEKTEVVSVTLTAEEQANLMAAGVSADELPTHSRQTVTELFRIDKVIALKDIIILVSEKTHRVYQYKMNYSCILFLRSYRKGRYTTLQEAGEFFFQKSTLLKEITVQQG